MKTISKKILLLPLLFSIFSCDLDYKYNTYNDLSSSHIEIDDIYSYEKETAIFFYQDGCSHCEDIERDVCHFISNEENKSEKKFNDFKFVFFEPYESNKGQEQRRKFKAKSITDDEQNLITEMLNATINTISDTYFFGTPTLMVVENYKLKNYIFGDNEIVSFLNN